MASLTIQTAMDAVQTENTPGLPPHYFHTLRWTVCLTTAPFRPSVRVQNFSRTDRLLRHRRLCAAGGVGKEEIQACCDSRASAYPQDPPGHTATWSPLQPSNNRLTV